MTVLPYLTVSLVAGIGSLDSRARQDPLPAGGSDNTRALGVSLGAVLLVPLAFPRHRDRVLLQHHPRGGPAEPRPRLALRAREPVPCAREQRGARRGPVQRDPRGGAHGRREAGAAPRVARRPRAGARPRQSLHDPPHAHRRLRHRRALRGDGGRPTARPAPRLPPRLRRDRPLPHAVRLPDPRGVRHPDPRPSRAPVDEGRPDHRLHDRRPLRRPAHADRPLEGASRRSGRPRRSGDRDARGDRARVLQLPARGQAPLPELRPLRGLVLGDDASSRRLSSPSRGGRGEPVRQRQRGDPVPPRSRCGCPRTPFSSSSPRAS